MRNDDIWVVIGMIGMIGMIILLFASVIANDVTNNSWQVYLIEKDHAEWRINAETGEKSFELIDFNLKKIVLGD